MKLKIISDGTPTGTKLIDEETGEAIHLIQKLTWEANANEFSTKITIELLNVPVEITSKADVDLYKFTEENQWAEPVHSKSFEKEIKVVSDAPNGKNLVLFTKVFDVQTKESVGAVQEIKWEATPDSVKAKVKRLRFDNKDW